MCYDTMPYMMIMCYVYLTIDLLQVLLEVLYITSVFVYIICEHHLPLGSDWPNAHEYGGCTSFRSGKCLHYSLQYV